MSGRFKLGALAVSALAAGALWGPGTAPAGHGPPARRADGPPPADPGALAVSALAAGALWVPVTALAGHGQPARRADVRHPAIRHVLAISVDGLHQSDLAWYVRNHPNSELAALAGGGAEYANAQTQIPSDSFPGTVGEFSGGDPRVTGV